MNTIVLKKNAYLRIFFNYNLTAIAKLPTQQKREQELRSLRSIDDSFLKSNHWGSYKEISCWEWSGLYEYLWVLDGWRELERI